MKNKTLVSVFEDFNTHFKYQINTEDKQWFFFSISKQPEENYFGNYIGNMISCFMIFSRFLEEKETIHFDNVEQHLKQIKLIIKEILPLRLI